MPPPFVDVSASTLVDRLIVPLLVVTDKLLPPRPVDVIKPAPVIDFVEPALAFRVTPPFAVSAPATAILLLLVRLKEPAPSVTELIEIGNPD